MSNASTHSSDSPDASKLDDLGQLLENAKQKHSDPLEAQPSSKADNSLLGMALRISTELVVSLLIGTALGLGIDHFAGTRPIFAIIGLIFGTAAGIRNTFRYVHKMDAMEQERLKEQGLLNSSKDKL